MGFTGVRRFLILSAGSSQLSTFLEPQGSLAECHGVIASHYRALRKTIASDGAPEAAQPINRDS